jgi:hypothetical protein
MTKCHVNTEGFVTEGREEGEREGGRGEEDGYYGLQKAQGGKGMEGKRG